jgi:hypothetical protein
MNNTRLSFQICIDESASLEELGARVGRALQCPFLPSSANLFAGEQALEAFCLGLWITLSCDMLPVDRTTPKNYVLMGSLRGDLEATCEDDYSIISISDYILTILKKLDEGAWYIPDMDELSLEDNPTPE